MIHLSIVIDVGAIFGSHGNSWLLRTEEQFLASHIVSLPGHMLHRIERLRVVCLELGGGQQDWAVNFSLWILCSLCAIV